MFGQSADVSFSQPQTMYPSFGDWNGAFNPENSGFGRESSDPLDLVSRYLEGDSSDKFALFTPRASAEVHKFIFIPFGSDVKVEFPVVCLSMIDCGPPDALRSTVVQHLWKEMIRVNRWQALVIYRLNGETSPHLDALYNGIAGNFSNVLVDPKHKFIQIPTQQPRPTAPQPPRRRK